jgi:hypothetical protein
MWCTEVDTVNDTVTLSARGMYGTTATAHADGALMRNEPRFPRAMIAEAINDTILSTYPDLWGGDTTTLTTVVGQISYELPADVEEVLEVSVDSNDGSGMWNGVRVWRFYPNANTTEYATGRALEIRESVASGLTIQVVYKKIPTVLADLSDNITDSGLAESARECLKYGAAARMIGGLMPSRFQESSAQAALISPNNNESDYLGVVRYFTQMYLQAREEEARRLNHRFPPRMNFTR